MRALAQEGREAVSDQYHYVAMTYGVNVAAGMRVIANGKRGVVVREYGSHQHYVHVQFDGNAFASPVHPSDIVIEGQPDEAHK